MEPHRAVCFRVYSCLRSEQGNLLTELSPLLKNITLFRLSSQNNSCLKKKKSQSHSLRGTGAEIGHLCICVPGRIDNLTVTKRIRNKQNKFLTATVVVTNADTNGGLVMETLAEIDANSTGRSH